VPPYAITSYGISNALGKETAAVLSGLFAGATGLTLEQPFPGRSQPGFWTPLGRTDLGTKAPFALPPSEGFSTRQDVLASLGLADVFKAARDAVDRYGPSRVAVILGTSTGGIESSEFAYQTLLESGRLPEGFSYDQHHALDAAARRVAARVGTTGPMYVVSTACSSSAKALASASRLLAGEWVDAALVGGVDSLCLLTLLGFHGLGVVDPVGCRPFAADRRGMNVGEGAAFVLLEREARSAVYLVGTGETSDAHHMAHPHPEGDGAQRAISAALEEANIEARQVDYVNAHGTGTLANDAAEAGALLRVLGRSPLVSSTKGQTGHLLGASGVTEAVFCAAAIQRQIAPGNRGVDNPELGLNVCVQPRAHVIDLALSSSFAFGGSNAVLAFASERAAKRSGKSVPKATRWLTLMQLTCDTTAPEKGALLSPRALGRASPLTVSFANLLSRLAAGGAAIAHVPQVFGSAFGEMHTTLELLDLQATRGESSPLRFQHSVHNAAQGVLSIAVGHRGFATSLSAGRTTLAMALLEAFGLVAAGYGEVLVMVAEEAAPSPLSVSTYGPLGVALHLSATADPRRPRLSLVPELPAGNERALPPAPREDLRQNPIADALDVAWLCQRGQRGAVALGGDHRLAAPDPSWFLLYHPGAAE
jgi:3-oxoacyl-[acyl-carrier-protein] synthase I